MTTTTTTVPIINNPSNHDELQPIALGPNIVTNTLYDVFECHAKGLPKNARQPIAIVIVVVIVVVVVVVVRMIMIMIMLIIL